MIGAYIIKVNSSCGFVFIVVCLIICIIFIIKLSIIRRYLYQGLLTENYREEGARQEAEIVAVVSPRR